MKKIIALLGLVALSGCSVLSPQKPQHISSDAVGDKGDLYSVPANLRTIDIRKSDADYIVCSEPVPDIAMSNALKLALDASSTQSAETAATTGDDSASGSVSNALGLKGSSDASTTALELAGRTQIVLLAREFIASNCKARANGWIDDSAFKDSQDKIIEQITAMITTEKVKAEAEKAKAEAVKSAVKLDPKALANVTDVFQQAKTDACLNTYDSCMVSVAGNSKKIKACKVVFGKCNN
ncbi:hypothetical protein [Teredinibacter turnerae]|uniref:hypothetical protein n=1 Tax=Teredinibacter turnerae TaxID=2426 RepID=UPI0030D2B26D